MGACLAVLMLIVACEAPHKNPLDPDNPDACYGKLQGTVIDAAGLSAIDNANVMYRPAGRWTLSDSNGVFELEQLVCADGWLIVQKPGYQTDS